MALIPNPQFNPNDPNSQRYIFDNPETAIINPTLGQTASGGVITTEKLTPVQPTNFQTAPPVPVPSVPDFTALGLEEQKTQTLSEEIIERQNKLLGKGAFERAQQEAAGLPEFQRQQRDLTSQLLAFKTEIEDLQNQAATIPSQVEEQFAGRGATRGGIAPHIAGELRKNQIKQATVASKALTISAQLQAIQRNIETANYMVELAVETKFGPIEEELAVKRANYDVIIKSPAFSAEQKARATALDEAAKKKEAATKAQRDAVEDARKMAIKAIENHPDDPNVAIISRQVMGFKDDDPQILSKATELLGKYQAKPEKAPSGQKTYIKLTPENNRELLGANLLPEMISNIEEGVRTIGIEEVLKDSYTDAQKAAIRKVYGKESKEVTQAQLLQAAQAMKQADVENFFTARYTEDEINKFAKDAGFARFFKKRATERANYLASTKAREKLAELLAEQYKQQGFTIK